MIISPLEKVRWDFRNPSRETGLRIWDVMSSNVDGTGIVMYSNRHNHFDLKARHPRVLEPNMFNILPELDPIVETHNKSYTIVIVTRDEYRVIVSERASERTLTDIERIIERSASQWSEDRTCATTQRYSINWSTNAQTYVINVIEFERDWS